MGTPSIVALCPTCLFVLLYFFSEGEDDLFSLLTEMMPVVKSWKAIGIGLGIGSGRLGAIQTDNPGNSRECLSEMLSCWLNRSYNVERFGEPTWRAVVQVVAHPAAGDNCALALNIAKQHSGNSQDANVHIYSYSCTFSLMHG